MTLIDAPGGQSSPPLPHSDPYQPRRLKPKVTVKIECSASGQGQPVRVLVSAIETEGLKDARWFRSVMTNVLPLLDLRPGWNSHGAMAINLRAVETGIAALIDLLHDDARPPATFPTASGGVNFEWSTSRFAIGLMAEPDDSVVLSYESDDEQWDGPPKDAPGFVRDALKALAS